MRRWIAAIASALPILGLATATPSGATPSVFGRAGDPVGAGLPQWSTIAQTTIEPSAVLLSVSPLKPTPKDIDDADIELQLPVSLDDIESWLVDDGSDRP